MLFCCLAFIIASNANAAKQLPVPRFAAIKFNEVNARTGPASDCPIEWVFVKKGEPVEIVAEYGHWRKIRDIASEGGWVHSSVLSGKRSVVVTAKGTSPLLEGIAEYKKIVVYLEQNIRCVLQKCKKDWCKIDCKSHKGWISRKALWGVYPDEHP
ncbi:MAG: hypothetical protein COA94_05885 [Rickettsiales bacterium]|nr:MAG: hypothetical protein COA94_05885 [Rickettsiales bacterium]